MSFYNERKIKSTRKERACIWCDELIPKGSEALYSACLHEGDFCDGYFHPECHPACQEYCRESYEGEYEPGNGVRGKSFTKDSL